MSATRSFRPGLELLEDRCVPSGDPVLFWNDVLLDANAADHALASPDQPGPVLTARAFAIVHVAIFDAVNWIDGSCTSYLVTQHTGPHDGAIDAAVARAAHDTLVALYPQQRETFHDIFVHFLADIDAERREIMRGLTIGRQSARVILEARADDGSDINVPYVPGDQPGDHQVDPLHPNQGFYGPGFGSITPFALTSSTQFPVPPPPALNTTAYTTAFNEVYVIGAVDAETSDRDMNGMPDRTAEQTQIGIFWGYDGTPGLGTPPRMYNQIIRIIAEQEGNTVVENARLFALANLAMADAGIACWQVKYQEEFWRPVVAIRAADTDGNDDTDVDPNWAPLGAPASNESGTNFTPPFPAYTSGHATFGAAAFRTLADFYGTDNIAFSFMSDEFNGITTDQFGDVRDPVTRYFTSFSQAAEENGQSRIYLGIHWSFDKVYGIQQGTEVADYVFANYMRPI